MGNLTSFWFESFTNIVFEKIMKIFIFHIISIFGLNQPSSEQPPLPACPSVACFNLLERYNQLSENYQKTVEEKLALKEQVLQLQISTNVDIGNQLAEFKQNHNLHLLDVNNNIKTNLSGIESRFQEKSLQLIQLGHRIQAEEKKFQSMKILTENL